MPLKRDEDNFGLAAFRAALQRQEGSFMRAGTLILNDPKKLSNNEQIAKTVMERGGQSTKKKKADDAD